MRHLSEDELVLLYYGEAQRPERVEQHLDACEACAAAYRAIAGTLSLVTPPDPPARDERYGLEVWQRIRLDLPVQELPWWVPWRRPVLVGAVTLLIVASFMVGRFWPSTMSAPTALQTIETIADPGERVRVAAISDHLEQSERVLLDLLNAQGPKVDVSAEQTSAADLIDAGRLYREASLVAGDQLVAGVLDELERSLLEIVHGPSTLTTQQLDVIRGRIDGASLVFKVRVLSNELRERETAPITTRKTI